MKMIVVTLPDADEPSVTRALLDEEFRITQIASTGTFLRSGTSTFFLGVRDERVEQAIQIIKNNITPSIEPGLRRVMLFVLNVEQFDQV
jgi:uncharacterized protein YaaQ